MSQASKSSTSKMSTFILALVIITLALSFSALILAFDTFIRGEQNMATYLALIGVIGLASSIYVIFQARKRAKNLKIKDLPIVTTIECRKCGFKNVRNFERGDYVLKELEPCEKCKDTNKMITAIYRKVDQKEKSSPF